MIEKNQKTMKFFVRKKVWDIMKMNMEMIIYRIYKISL